MSNLPNILFITADQLRADALGCYGNEVIDTRNIDALAARGVRFTRMFAAYPVCAPNRGSMATGRYPTIHGLRANGMRLPQSELTLMEVLRRNGYRTYGAGKMHFGPQWQFPADGSPIKDPDPSTAFNPQPEPGEFPWYGFDAAMLTEDHRTGPYADYLAEHGLSTSGMSCTALRIRSLDRSVAFPRRTSPDYLDHRPCAGFRARDGDERGEPAVLSLGLLRASRTTHSTRPRPTTPSMRQTTCRRRCGMTDEVEGWPEAYRASSLPSGRAMRPSVCAT